MRTALSPCSRLKPTKILPAGSRMLAATTSRCARSAPSTSPAASRSLKVRAAAALRPAMRAAEDIASASAARPERYSVVAVVRTNSSATRHEVASEIATILCRIESRLSEPETAVPAILSITVRILPAGSGSARVLRHALAQGPAGDPAGCPAAVGRCPEKSVATLNSLRFLPIRRAGTENWTTRPAGRTCQLAPVRPGRAQR